MRYIDMADKSYIESGIVNAGQNHDKVFAVIPAGEIWKIVSFKCADINMGDNKSSVFVIYFGFDVINFYSVTGDTILDLQNYELVGDGTKSVKITRMNKSGSNKVLPYKITAYSRTV